MLLSSWITVERVDSGEAGCSEAEVVYDALSRRRAGAGRRRREVGAMDERRARRETLRRLANMVENAIERRLRVGGEEKKEKRKKKKKENSELNLRNPRNKKKREGREKKEGKKGKTAGVIDG